MHTLALLTQRSVHPTALVLFTKDSRNEISYDFQPPFSLHISISRTKPTGFDFYYHLITCHCLLLHRGRMIPEELEKLIIRHKSEGHLPFFVNCTTGTTVYGAYDPIEPIADICEKYGIWLHIDVSKSHNWVMFFS